VRPLPRLLHALLTGLAFFLGISALAGGTALLAGFQAPPVEQLKGSIFNDFVIPGLALVLVVGGSATAATVLLVKRSPNGLPAALAAGVAVMIFEFVEVLAIGSPPGPARAMQLLYFGIGAALVTVSSVALVQRTESRKHTLSNPQNAPNSSNTDLASDGNKRPNVSRTGNVL
jgi:hypothetical protein